MAFYTTVETESCCTNKHSATVRLAKSIPFYFELKYVQWEKARNGPCMRLSRESGTDIPLDSIDLEAMSLTELYESPFHVTAVMNKGFASAEKSGFALMPLIDANTNLTVSEAQV